MSKREPIATEFEILENNGQLYMMQQLIDLKNILARQLPKMPKEYIIRLLFNKNHQSIVVKNNNKIIGGICYCFFIAVHLCEVVFLAISSDFQTHGLGAMLMDRLKQHAQKSRIHFIMTCADNLAIGYFKKQGFHRNILMPSQLFNGYLKDYEGSTLMEFLVHPNIDYLNITNQLTLQQSYIVEIYKSLSTNGVLYSGVPENAWKKTPNQFGTRINPLHIPGLIEARFNVDEFTQLRQLPCGKTFKENCIKVLNLITAHTSAWPFLTPVKKEEVPDYTNYIKDPMDFQTIRDKVNRNSYPTKQLFEKDIFLVFKNAKEYNSKATIFYKCAVKLETYSKELLENLKSPSKKEGGKSNANKP